MQAARLLMLITFFVPLALLAQPREPQLERSDQAPPVIHLETTTAMDLLSPPRFDLTQPAVNGLNPAGASVIRWYGSYDPMTRTAVEGDVWSFDHGTGDPLEGWTSVDDAVDFPAAWRRITATIWAGHDNPVPAPVISGTGSAWLGLFEDETQGLCWTGGLGYGDDWTQRFETPTLTYQNMTGSSVTLTYNYFCDTELFYDYVDVVLKVNGSRVDTVASYNGSIGSPSSSASESLSVDVGTHAGATGSFSLVFELVSDSINSDENGGWNTANGAFGLDDVQLFDNIVEGPQTHDFEVDDEGFTASIPTGAGTFMAVHASANYILADTSCAIEDNVLAFHDGGQSHPEYQLEMAVSPPVPLSVGGNYNIFADYDVYQDLELDAGIFWRSRWSYYPYICPITGDSSWAPPTDPIWHFSGGPVCSHFRMFATQGEPSDQVPAGADSVRLHLAVWNACPGPYSDCSLPDNFSPIFDNIRVGVTGATVRHVPTSDYPTIQAAIDSAAAGDTVLVRAGTYTGAGNRNLDFKGKAILVCSEEGPGATVIDCEGAARGFWFHSGETGTSILDGFTVTGGVGGGGGLYCTSSPKVRNCWFVGNGIVTEDGGGAYVTGGSPAFEDCVFGGNNADTGGGIYIDGGNPTVTGCLIAGNNGNSSGGAVYVVSGSPYFQGCTLTKNDTGTGTAGIHSSGTVIMERCIVYGNCNLARFETRTSGSGTISFICSDVDQSRDAGLGISYDANSISVDPAFCAPADCDSVPTTAGDYTLASHSPCLPQFSLCGQLIGALGVGCFGNYPQLSEVEDVPNDQGRQVRLTWTRSIYDGPTGPVITGYTVWRRVNPLFGPGPVPDSQPESVRFRILSHPGEWDYIGMVMARGDDEYHMVVPTLCDSTDAGLCLSTFFVSAVTADPLDHYDSETLSGYSVDNLAPAAPVGLIFTSYQLTWQEALEADFDFFKVYGSSVEMLDEAAVPLGHTVGTEMDVHSDPWPFYHVTATDFAGNEGEAASTSNQLAVPEPGITPSAFALAPNWPNPFRSSTNIGFDLPTDSRVRLTVFDVSGRLVRVLLDAPLPTGRYSVPWRGDDSRGRRVSPGIYLYRVEAGEFRKTRKAIAIH